MVIQIRKTAFFISVCFVLLIVELYDGASFMGYMDDIIPLFMLLYAVRGAITKRISKTCHQIGVLLSLICLFGFVSNLMTSMNNNVVDIISDCYSFIKMFAVYIGVDYLLYNNPEAADDTILGVSKIAKLFIIVSFIFGVLNFMGIVNMSEQVRFGMNTFSFIFGNASQYGVVLGVALAIIIFSNPKHLFFYEIIGLITMVFTLKGMTLIIVAIYVSMSLISIGKVKLIHIVIVGGLLLFVLRYQIATYLLDQTAPRAILIRYGAITANTYFPVGSGFGTYGSAVAAKHYSPLYTQYGFYGRRALMYSADDTSSALFDCYLGMALGQFGWIATVLLIAVFAMIGRDIFNKENNDKKSFFISIGLFFCMCGMAIMAGSVKNIPGQTILIALALYKYKSKLIHKEIVA